MSFVQVYIGHREPVPSACAQCGRCLGDAILAKGYDCDVHAALDFIIAVSRSMRSGWQQRDMVMHAARIARQFGAEPLDG